MALAEKRMMGIVYDWWMGTFDEERRAVMEAGLATLELLLKTQFVPEPVDERKIADNRLKLYGTKRFKIS